MGEPAICDGLRRMAKCIYIAVEPPVADDISARSIKAADTIAALYEALADLVESWRAPDGSLPRGPKCVRAYAALSLALGEKQA